MWYFMWGLELVQQHFCSGHREVDKKMPASLAPPPLLFLSCLQRPDTYRLVLVNRAPSCIVFRWMISAEMEM